MTDRILDAHGQGVDLKIAAILADRGVVTCAEHPRLKSVLVRLRAAGVLGSPFPGVFVRADDHSEATWLRAVCAWAAPHGVLHADTAAGLWLSGLSTVTAVAHPTLKPGRRVAVTRRTIPRQFVRSAQGLRFATPAYAAVELAARDDGRAICEALRRRLATTAELEEALAALAGTDGQAVRRCVVSACLSNPWSYGELRLHRILRAAGITGWVANAPLRLGGVLLQPDVLFPEHGLVVEFDGRAVHADAGQFLKDRERENALVSHGYVVLRFGWEHLDDPEYVVSLVRRSLQVLARRR